MRIESVTAHAFGPLVDQTLTLAPGLTVITGVNESAKSSWHAALHAALVGRRRGKGAPTREERHFAEMHRPWDGTEWRVSAILTLDDGRRVEVTHELDGKVDCRATDLAMGVDISSEIMFEGAPDASRFLGLDRRSFAATAVVNQADMLSVLAAADGLQEHLQRAAATAGTDSTAAAALAAIERFSRDNVGLDRSNSTKPLRASRDALAVAEAELAAARSSHEQFQALVADADQQRTAADQAATRTERAELAAAALEQVVEAARVVAKCQADADRASAAAAEVATKVDALSRRVTRARVLTAGGANERGLPTAAATESTARIVASALASWAAAPANRIVNGPTATELRLQLDALPNEPDGDTAVAPEVRAASDGYAQARAIAAAHLERRTPDPGETSGDVAAAISAGPAVVRELAAQLAAARTTTPAGPADVQAELDAARKAHEEATEEVARSEASELSARTRYAAATASASSSPSSSLARATMTRRVLLVCALLGAAAAGVALVAGAPVVSAAAGALGVLALVGAALAHRKALPAVAKSPAQDLEGLASAVGRAVDNVKTAQSQMYATMRTQADLEARLVATQTASSAIDDVTARCAARSLPADVSVLHTLAAQAEQHLEVRREYTHWADVHTTYVEALARVQSRLVSVLAEHGQEQTGEDVQSSLTGYEDACARRADQHARAAQRTELERALATREIADAEVQDAAQRRTDARHALLEAARQIGAEVGTEVDPAELVASLEQWQAEYGEMLTVAEARKAGAAQLEAVLDGASLTDLERDLAQLQQEADRLDQVARQAEVRTDEAIQKATAEAAAVGLDGAAITDVDSAVKHLVAAEDDAAEARAEELALARAAENAAGVSTERGRSLTSVAEAEESAAAARAYLNRVQKLAETLELTAQFLASAQAEVHRNIAPLLTGTLRSWLPRVTAGRYTDATVNPATLNVSVCGPQRRWRPADRLSIGTAEQVYLLLRVALAQHLTTTAESCPLLLDDVTVQADPERTTEILNLLLELSADRQIVLFAQEPAVTTWASEHLSGTDRHSALEVPRVTVE